jgi:hypothetical protein
MTTVVVDFFCALLLIAGVTLALKGARASRGGGIDGSPPPATYITRIAGTMMAVFALALATMVTVFALSSS